MPLILKRITKTETRSRGGEPLPISGWKPYQVAHSERRQALTANKTLFNLVPCNRELEVAFTGFADRAPDVVAFAKNAGPQSLRIDYLSVGGRLSFHTPDFFVRTQVVLAADKGKLFLLCSGRHMLKVYQNSLTLSSFYTLFLIWNCETVGLAEMSGNGWCPVGLTDEF